MLEKLGYVVVDVYSITSSTKKCRDCKYFNREEYYKNHGSMAVRCPKTGIDVHQDYGCYSQGWKIKMVRADQEIEVDADKRVIFTVVGREPYFIIAEPIFLFEPREEE